MTKIITTGDRVLIQYEATYTGALRNVTPNRFADYLSQGIRVALKDRDNFSVQNISSDFEVGDIIRHRAKGSVRVLEPTGFRILKSDHMKRGEFVEYEPGWDLYNFTTDKWEKVAHIG